MVKFVKKKILHNRPILSVHVLIRYVIHIVCYIKGSDKSCSLELVDKFPQLTDMDCSPELMLPVSGAHFENTIFPGSCLQFHSPHWAS